MDYKNTLNLPKTDFPMKADLPKREPIFLKKWLDIDIYGLIRKKSQGNKKYILHDGPPYANGDIHIGHALNKTLKDIIVKYKTMRGFDSAYIPGWDCHGLPVEHQLFKELKINKYQIPQLEFRKKAYDYAMRYVGIQKEEFRRLGVFGDWENPYLTLSPEYEEAIITSLGILQEKGYIYRGLKPVNWCFRCETALAEAEVEYEDHTSPSVFVKFKLESGQDYPQDTYFLIWTTTPWTLIANVAVAAHPDFTYVCIKTGQGNLIVAKDLLENVLSKSQISEYEVIREAKGRQLEGLTYAHPFGLRKGRLVLADYVSRDEGSGLVHTAPGHGNEDYFTGIKYKLEIVMPVDAKGKFDSSAAELSGINVYDANPIILEKLKKEGALLFSGEIKHSYPHCWRCKKPVIFRATKQWFLNIDHNGLRESLLKAIKENVKWVPESGRERISAMVELRPDWCLSRQRYWGVPIPALVCEKCQEEVLEPQVIKKFAEFASKEGSDTWFSRPVDDFLPQGYRCKCGHDRFIKGSDILDVWFDSGVSSQAVLKKRKGLSGVPAQLYLEGSDQHRGWFQSSLIPAVCIDAKPPFESVLTHGFVVDGEGKKMSKSLGNVISPFDIIKDYGADILRMWVASSDYNEDIRISKEILTRLSEAYRKIRNTARFVLSNLYDFDPDKDKVKPEELNILDRWLLRKTNDLIRSTESAYDSFWFYMAYKPLYDFCNEKLSMYYLDMVKGRLYTYKADSVERRACQTVMHEVLSVLVRIMAPLVAFTAEEIWQSMPKEKKYKDLPSVHLLDWPEADLLPDEGLDSVMGLIPDVAKALEGMRTKAEIGSSFDAKIKLLTNNEERYRFLTSLRTDLCEIFKVSQVEIEKVENIGSDAIRAVGLPDIGIMTLKADGAKCVRCWNYSTSVGKDAEHSQICGKCLTTV